ncbi:MAG TPA: hypothetical protein VMV07_21605, partial [Streptosporangiaceae bacterium]|nr:hypothetical protein [Streptosporangiaceae bacterium]
MTRHYHRAAADEELVVITAMDRMVLVEGNTMILSDSRHLGQQFPALRSVRLPACHIKSSWLPKRLRADKNFFGLNKLRKTNASTPRILVVIGLEPEGERVLLRRDGTLLVGCGAWVSLAGR